MGEYAKYHGEEVKIGTCEDMLYLRADQAHLVQAVPGSVDPVKDRDGIRFRFPFPEEDGIAPGEFDDPFKGVTLYSVRAPEGVDHGRVQFKADNGYLVSLPCPEQCDRGLVQLTDGTEQPYTVHRNGHPGASELVQQRYWEGRLVAVLKCKACGHMWRMPEFSDAEPVIVALRSEADAILRRATATGLPAGSGDVAAASRLHTIADRVTAGYKVKAEALATA